MAKKTVTRAAFKPRFEPPKTFEELIVRADDLITGTPRKLEPPKFWESVLGKYSLTDMGCDGSCIACKKDVPPTIAIPGILGFLGTVGFMIAAVAGSSWFFVPMLLFFGMYGVACQLTAPNRVWNVHGKPLAERRKSEQLAAPKYDHVRRYLACELIGMRTAMTGETSILRTSLNEVNQTLERLRSLIIQVEVRLNNGMAQANNSVDMLTDARAVAEAKLSALDLMRSAFEDRLSATGAWFDECESRILKPLQDFELASQLYTLSGQADTLLAKQHDILTDQLQDLSDSFQRLEQSVKLVSDNAMTAIATTATDDHHYVERLESAAKAVNCLALPPPLTVPGD